MAPATATIAQSLAPAAAVRRLGDVRLAHLAAAGNTDAFAAIYERHDQELYRYCRSILIRQLVADLGRLPERQRGAPLMRELGGLSYDESAERSRCP